METAEGTSTAQSLVVLYVPIPPSTVFAAHWSLRKTFWPHYVYLDAAPQTRTSEQDAIVVSSNALPPTANQIFSTDQSLPSPAEVLDRAVQQGIDITKTWRPDPIRFYERRLIIKWGEDVTVAEGHCLWFIRQHLAKELPVPEVYGWDHQNGLTFLYLELIDGDPLSERWDELNSHTKAELCHQLKRMIATWHCIEPPPNSTLQLSQIGDQPLRDIHFSNADAEYGAYPAGPFQNISDFHNSFGRLDTTTSIQEKTSRT
ncbi:hypothetical protein AC579_3177 [Pseudocercospora musae]|uniref:Aminoglycoside phosphotransferase domain-containing protein n=1 Tax=Pseudocercospora musae TaxID=113226 RepID=A0A139H3H2_9PEZI|nr:hypothetical protein AC579_3177 [Pseudocercospora musae]